jgi:hypothetical protein
MRLAVDAQRSPVPTGGFFTQGGQQMFLNPTQYYLPQGVTPQFAYPGMPFGGQNPFTSQAQPWAGNSFAGGQSPLLQQIVPMVGQLAQQISIHSAVTQQIGVLLHQVAHQLALQSQSGFAGQSLGGSPFLGGLAHSSAQTPFAFGPGGYPGFGPQGQSWGAGRPQTVQ